MAFTLEDLTVAIMTYKRPAELADTLATVGGVPNVQVTLNGSSAHDYERVIEKFGDSVTFMQNLVNIGVAATANRQIMEAPTRFVVMSTDACDYQDRWWDPLLEILNGPTPPHQVSLSHPKRFTAWCIDKELVGLQGWFDHNFTQVYYEDEDYFLRTMERLGLHGEDVSLDDVMPVLSVVLRRPPKKASWNSIPNRTYFWRKWERVDPGTPDSLILRDGVIVKRKRPDPSFPYLAMVQDRYRNRDYSAVPFVYDEPTELRMLTKLTSNPIVTGARRVVSRLTNPSQGLR